MRLVLLADGQDRRRELGVRLLDDELAPPVRANGSYTPTTITAYPGRGCPHACD